MEQNIVIERHYLTPQMYREMYLGYPHYFINRYHQSNYPIINQNQHPNLASGYNQNIPIFPQTPQIYQNNINTNPIYQPTTHSANQPFNHYVNRPNQRENTNVNVNTNATTNANQTTTNNAINTPNGGGTQAPAEIRNLINNLINNNTPFQLEVSTLPITRILNQFRAEMNGRDDDNSGISLANINNMSSVNVFSALSSNNTSEEMCSICQNEFEGSDIVRRLNNCNHIFHLNCVDTWLSNHNTCPTCRNDLTNTNSEDTSDEEENYSDPESATEEEDDDEDNYEDDEEYECHDECDSNCGCDCHDEEEDYTDCDDDESIAAAPISTTSNNSITPQDNEERDSIINYFVITNSRNASNTNTENTSNISLSNPNSLPTSTTNSTTNSTTTNTTRHSLNNSNIHIFTSNGINAGAVLGEFQNDINHIINLGTPFINTILGTNNTASELNATHINGNVNNMISAINPILSALNNLIINNNNTNHHH